MGSLTDAFQTQRGVAVDVASAAEREWEDPNPTLGHWRDGGPAHTAQLDPNEQHTLALTRHNRGQSWHTRRALANLFPAFDDDQEPSSEQSFTAARDNAV